MFLRLVAVACGSAPTVGKLQNLSRFRKSLYFRDISLLFDDDGWFCTEMGQNREYYI